MTDNDLKVLYHYGIKRRSGRYPYGSGDRPFQGEITAETRSKRESGLSRYIRQWKEKKGVEERARKEAAQKKAAEEAAKKEAKKPDVISSGKASDVLQYRGQLTNKELSDALQRLNFEARLNELSAKETSNIWNQLNDLAKKMDSISKIATSTNTIYAQVNTMLKNLGLSEKDQQENRR